MEAIIWEVRLLLQCEKELGMKGNQRVELCVDWSKLLSHSFPWFLFLLNGFPVFLCCAGVGMENTWEALL